MMRGWLMEEGDRRNRTMERAGSNIYIIFIYIYI
jgi:hypothetical protein